MFDRTVKLPDDYFKKDKRQYSNWIFAFFRELLQNSIDAGASKINVSISSNGESIEVTFSDDGCGMDEPTLFNGFLCMGGSIKGENSIGGFGQAKIIILFAHESYRIKTQDNIIEGIGGNYSHSKSNNWVQGTEVSVVMNDDSYSNENRLKEEFLTLLQNSHLRNNITINLNGDCVYKNSKAIKGRDLSNLRFNHKTNIGEMKFDDQQGMESTLWIRVDGLAMFKHCVWPTGDNVSGFYGVLDLDKPSSEILTANRDSLQFKYSSSLNSIFNELSTERSALKATSLIDFTFNDEGDFVSRNFNSGFGVNGLVGQESATNQSDRVFGQTSTANNSAAPHNSPFAVEIKKAETENEKINRFFERVKKRAYPASFRVKKSSCSNSTYAKMAATLNQTKIIKGAHNWISVMSNILSTEYFHERGMVFIDQHGRETSYSHDKDGQFYFRGKRISFGFIFSETCNGSCVSKDYSIEILVNPNFLKEKYLIGDLIDIGTHEAAHIVNSYHDESFCSTEIEIRKSLRRFTKENKILEEGKTLYKKSTM